MRDQPVKLCVKGAELRKTEAEPVRSGKSTMALADLVKYSMV